MFLRCFHLTSLSESKNDITKSIEIFYINDTDSSLYEYENDMKLEGENINNMNIDEELIYQYIESNDLYHGFSLSSFGQISSIKNDDNLILENTLNFNKIKDNLQLNSSSFFTYIQNISYMFAGCIFLISLPELSQWNISKSTDKSDLFSHCCSLKSLPDISKWDISDVKEMYYVFSKCNSLKSLPDISNWRTSEVIKMNHMFNECNSLISLPDISKWNTSNVTNIKFMFNKCNSLISLPDISN